MQKDGETAKRQGINMDSNTLNIILYHCYVGKFLEFALIGHPLPTVCGVCFALLRVIIAGMEILLSQNSLHVFVWWLLLRILHRNELHRWSREG